MLPAMNAYWKRGASLSFRMLLAYCLSPCEPVLTSYLGQCQQIGGSSRISAACHQCLLLRNQPQEVLQETPDVGGNLASLWNFPQVSINACCRCPDQVGSEAATSKPPPELDQQMAAWAWQCTEFRRATWMPARPGEPQLPFG